MFKALNAIVENEINESNLDFYTVIIGTKPSQGARSPKLWNKVYDYEEMANEFENKLSEITGVIVMCSVSEDIIYED